MPYDRTDLAKVMSRTHRVGLRVCAFSGVLLLASCATTGTRETLREYASAPMPIRVQEPRPLLDEPPPVLLAHHLPAPDPGLALIYQSPAGREAYGVRRSERAWQANSGRLIQQFREQEWESWKQGLAAIPPQSEELLLEEVLRLNIPEDSKIPFELHKILLLTESDLPLTLNDQVFRYVNYFLARGRTTLRESLRRAGAYRSMISRILAEEGVPQDLIYVVQAESGFRPKVRSRVRATGMWQFMAPRGREYGLNQNRLVDERMDPEKATRAAARHLADLYAEFGDWYLALAAYNCGPGCVQRAVERTGYADYWEHVKRSVIPRETANYVPVILAMALLAKNAETFGLDDIVPESPIRYDSVPTYTRISLDLVADLTGSTVPRLKDLNPALLASATPDGPYTLRVPRGTGHRFQEEIVKVPEAGRSSWRRHEVRENETLAEIAARYRVRAADIAAVNHIPPEGPGAGERLNIPVPVRQARVEPVRTAGPGRYVVRSGDTLSSIARRYRVSAVQIQRWNGLRGTLLQVGQVLTVHPAAASGPGRPAPKVAASAKRAR
jgi:membrane-bound lytic murein transglycosylase D